MTEPGTAPLRYWCGGACLGALAWLALGGMALADGTRDAAALEVADRAPDAVPLGPVPTLTADMAAVAVPQDEERRRRMLLLLLMRSAARLGPYGGLGQ